MTRDLFFIEWSPRSDEIKSAYAASNIEHFISILEKFVLWKTFTCVYFANKPKKWSFYSCALIILVCCQAICVEQLTVHYNTLNFLLDNTEKDYYNYLVVETKFVKTYAGVWVS